MFAAMYDFIYYNRTPFESVQLYFFIQRNKKKHDYLEWKQISDEERAKYQLSSQYRNIHISNGTDKKFSITKAAIRLISSQLDSCEILQFTLRSEKS